MPRAPISRLWHIARCAAPSWRHNDHRTEWFGDDLRRIDPKFQEPRFSQYLAAVDGLKTLARERYGARCWLWQFVGCSIVVRTVALWGARRPHHLDPVDEALGWRLDDAAMSEIDRIVDAAVHDPSGPNSWRRRYRCSESRLRAVGDGSMGLVNFALKYRVTFYVLAVLIVLGGVGGIVIMPKDVLPVVNMPVVTIVWTYTGLDTAEMDQRVATYSEYALSNNVQ